MSSGFSSMLKRAAATATAAVSAAVSTIGGGGVGDEQFDSYRTRVEGLQRDMLNLKDKCGMFSKAAMNMAVSGGEVSGEFRSLYRASAPRSAMVDKFATVQQRIDESAFKAFSIDVFGSQVLGVLDEWQAESTRVLDDIRNAETALDEVRKLQDKVAAGKQSGGKDSRRQPGASNSADAMQQQAEDMLARFERNLTTQRAELDKRVSGFVDGRYAVLDAVFVRFMELQAEFAQSLVAATNSFTPSIAAYRKKVPLGSTGPLSPRSSLGNGSMSPSASQQSFSPSTDMFASAASASASSASAGRPSVDAAAQQRKSTEAPKAARGADDDEDSSDDDDSDSDDSDDDDSDDDDETPRSNNAHHSKAKAAPAAGKAAAPRVSTGASGSVSPRSSQPSSPANGGSSGTRSTTASPDLLKFGGGGDKGNTDDLMDLFSGAAKTAPSPTNKKPAPAAAAASANSSSGAPADDLSLFDFSGPAKPASPPPNARGAAGGKQQPSHSSSMDFDPLAASSQPAAPASKPATAAAPSASSSAASSRSSSTLQREDSRSALNAVAKGMVKTDDLDKHIEDQQEKRLEELRAAEEEQLKDAADKKVATHALEDRLNAWSTKDGQRKNIRQLLASLHTVLWPNSGWKTAGLADLIDPNAIKKQHRKAILIVHPDKLQDATPEQKVIAEHAFDALNTAFDRFQETGQ